MTWANAKIKRIYVWTTKVRPVWKYSYDFRNKSTSQITNDWWTYSAWTTPYFESNWVYGDIVRLAYDISSHISNAKKITIQFSAWIVSSWWAWVRLAKTVTSSSRVWLTWPWYNTNSETYMQIYDTNNSYSWLSNWTYTFNWVIDLAAKTWSLSITWKTTQTWTLTDTQVSNILNNTTKLFVFTTYNSSSAAVSDLKLTIEY